MNRDELKQIGDYFRDCFPDSAKQFEALSAESKKRWSSALIDLNYFTAKRAIDRLFCGEEDHPRSIQGWPAAICKLARAFDEPRKKLESTKRYLNPDMRGAVLCKTCCDMGVIFVWHPTSMRDALERIDDDNKKDVRIYSAATACTCDTGTAKLPALANTRFDPAKMLPFPLDFERREALEELQTFMHTIRATQMF